MVQLVAYLDGDKQIQQKINELSKGITRWMANRAFKPAAALFIDPVIDRIKPSKRRLGTRKNIRAGAMKKSRVMMGARLLSTFGTTDGSNDPYYGAFYNYGHFMGPRALGSARPWIKGKRSFDKGFNAKKNSAAALARTNLAREIEKAWALQHVPPTGPA